MRSERSRDWGSGGRLRHRCLQPECWREGHLASVGPDGIAHGSPLSGAVSTEAAPKVTARLGRDLAELPLPPQLLGFGRPVGLQTTSCSPPSWGELPGDLPEDSAYQPLPWHEQTACSKKNKEKAKQTTVVLLHLSQNYRQRVGRSLPRRPLQRYLACDRYPEQLRILDLGSEVAALTSQVLCTRHGVNTGACQGALIWGPDMVPDQLVLMLPAELALSPLGLNIVFFLPAFSNSMSGHILQHVCILV